MLTISDSMKQAYNQYTTQRKSYIKIGDSSFFVQNLNIEADCYDAGNVIGNAISKIAKFEIETEYVNQLDEFEIFDGIWTGEKYEYISLGTFKLFEEKGTDNFFSSIIAYDKLVLFNSTYDSNLVVFPTTVYGLLQSICNQASVELYNTTIANGDQPLESNLFVEGESLKHILKAICQISGCFAIISEDKLKLLLKNTDTLTLEKHQISQPEYKRTTWKINQVVLGMTDIDGEYVKYPDDTEIQGSIHKLVINDNPFVYTQELREAYIQNIYNQVNGFGYIAFETNWEGMPFVEIGDSLIIDANESIVLRYNLKSPNGLESTLSAPSIIDSVVEYVDNSDSIAKRMRKTEYKVNKMEGTITATVETVTEQETKINNMTQTVDNLNITISNQQNTFDNLNNSIVGLEGTLEDMSFNFSTKGLAVGTSIDPNNSLLDNTGIKVYNYNKLNAIFNNKGSGIDKLIVTGTAQIGYFKTVKSEKTYMLDGVSVTKKANKHFFLKELIEDLEDLM